MANLRMPDLGKIVQIPSLAKLAQSGIYFLLYEEVVVYVGQARNMRRRIADHIGEGTKMFDSIAHVPCEIAKLAELERAYIEKLVPKYNRCHVANCLREAGAQSATAGKLIGTERRIRIPRANVRRTIMVLE